MISIMINIVNVIRVCLEIWIVISKFFSFLCNFYKLDVYCVRLKLKRILISRLICVDLFIYSENL